MKIDQDKGVGTEVRFSEESRNMDQKLVKRKKKRRRKKSSKNVIVGQVIDFQK